MYRKDPVSGFWGKSGGRRKEKGAEKIPVSVWKSPGGVGGSCLLIRHLLILRGQEGLTGPLSGLVSFTEDTEAQGEKATPQDHPGRTAVGLKLEPKAAGTGPASFWVI